MTKDKSLPSKTTKVIIPDSFKQGPPKGKPGSGRGDYQAPRKPKTPVKK